MLSEKSKQQISEKLKGIPKSSEIKEKIKTAQNKNFAYLYNLAKDEVDSLIYDYDICHYTLKQCMEKYGLSKRVVRNYLTKNGISIRDNSSSHKVFISKEKEMEILNLYNNSMTISQVSKELNLTRGIVYNTLIKYNANRHQGEINKGKHLSDETKQKISQKNKGHWVNLEKQIETKRKNNSFNISKPELKMLDELREKYGYNNVLYHYKDNERYPFYCDFYVISEDLFIELNAHWTHGEKPFDENDKECIEKLSLWKEKAKTSKFYKQAIYIWTILDVKKLNCAKEHNLNYKQIY